MKKTLRADEAKKKIIWSNNLAQVDPWVTCTELALCQPDTSEVGNNDKLILHDTDCGSDLFCVEPTPRVSDECYACYWIVKGWPGAIKS